MSPISKTLNHNTYKNNESVLERHLIAEYLLSKGYRESDLQILPEKRRKELMKEACIYATVKLANIEAKSKFRQKIKGP
ncbi:MAG: hypothetical protein WAV05_14110 [Anaerolineales bacterium]